MVVGGFWYIYVIYDIIRCGLSLILLNMCWRGKKIVDLVFECYCIMIFFVMIFLS